MNAQYLMPKIKHTRPEIPNHQKSILSPLILHFTLCFSVFVFLVTGCSTANKKESPAVEIEQLKQKNEKLRNQIEQSNSENKKLKEQIQVLSGIPENERLEILNRLETIKIGRYTGFFDKDDDGKKEKLIVYIQPIDKQGDTIKAAGAAEVQLWDLNKSENQALLGQWKVEADELKKLWFSTMITTNYRLTFDVADIVESMEAPLTVMVTFTDYMTGKVFKEQTSIKAP